MTPQLLLQYIVAVGFGLAVSLCFIGVATSIFIGAIRVATEGQFEATEIKTEEK